jgi:shikimate dehydrogenase
MPNFGLIGNPLTHSFSKAYFTSKFEREGLDNYRYTNFEIENIGEVKDIINLNELKGINVTIPFKESVIPFLDILSDEVTAIGAANTILKTENGKLIGFNTDYIGFRDSLKPLLKPYHTQALILGTGGSSKAIAYALDLLGIQYQKVGRISSPSNYYTYSELTSNIIRNAPLIINTTPLGTFPDVQSKPEIPYAGLDKFHLLFDLIYNPAETAFLQMGKLAGAATMNGYQMLIKQAEESWKIWRNQ